MIERFAIGDFVAALRHALAGTLPGREAQNAMAVSPRSARPPERQGLPFRQGAVLLLLYYVDGQWFFPLVRRSQQLRLHRGQIGLPGGAQETGDASLWETALREAAEEIGIFPEQILYVGALTPLEIPVSEYVVHPFVGYASTMPIFHINEAEVESLIEFPLQTLLDPAAKRAEEWLLHGRPTHVPFYYYQGAVIWGATAMILSELEALLRRLA